MKIIYIIGIAFMAVSAFILIDAYWYWYGISQRIYTGKKRRKVQRKAFFYLACALIDMATLIFTVITQHGR